MGKFLKINPSNEEVLGEFKQSTNDEVTSIVDVAKDAQKIWRNKSRINRAELLDNLVAKMKDSFDMATETISKETGKSLNESAAEVNEAIHMVQYAFGKGRESVGEMLPSEIPEKDVFLIKKPKGVVGVIPAWNFPYAVPFWNIAPALLEGNTVVFKPSELVPLTGQLIADLHKEAGFPDGVFNLIQGDGEVGEALTKSSINHICFTGSYDVGKFIKLECANNGKKTCSCEMGSKSAVIVCADADMDMAVKACVASAYKLSGQRCVSAGRLLIQRNVFNEFAAKFISASKKLVIGNPFDDPRPDMGPLINNSQLERVLKFNEASATDPDTTVLLGAMHSLEKGFFITPHVYKTEWKLPEKRNFLANEVFGPHVALIPFDDLDHAMAIYNDTDYGLSLAVCTNDYRKMRKVRDNCDFGLGYVNLPCIGAESGIPFGGVKKSGYGGSSAAGTFDNVVHKVAWTVNHAEEIKMAQGLKL